MIGQQSRHKMPVESPIHFNISHYNNTPSSSSPMAVPNNLRKYSTMSTGSPACGRCVYCQTDLSFSLILEVGYSTLIEKKKIIRHSVTAATKHKKVASKESH